MDSEGKLTGSFAITLPVPTCVTGLLSQGPNHEFRAGDGCRRSSLLGQPSTLGAVSIPFTWASDLR